MTARHTERGRRSMLFPSTELTPAEIECLQLAAEGMRSVDIARARGNKLRDNRHASACAVRKVWKQAMDKLGADTVTQAVAMCFRRGLLE